MSEYLQRVGRITQNAQQKVVLENDTSRVVLAGPGSGKSYLLTAKAAHLVLSRKVELPQKIACLTYSRFLEAQLQAELRKLGVLDAEQIFVGTVHSFFIAEILFPFRDLLKFTIPFPFRIATYNEQIQALSAALRTQLLAPTFQRSESDLLNELSKFRRLGVTHETLASKPSVLQFLKQIDWDVLAAEYLENLGSGSFGAPSTDFVQIEVMGAHAVQEHQLIRASLASKYPWWLIDEYQDLGLPFHSTMLQMLLNTEIEILAIGDENQCIYEELQGSKPEFISELSDTVQRCRGTEKVNLSTNYRSTQPIISVSEKVLNRSLGYNSSNNASTECYCVELERPAMVYNAIKRLLEYLVTSPKGPQFTPSRIGILHPYRNCNTSVGLNNIANALNAFAVPYKLDKDPDFSQNFEIVSWIIEIAKWCTGGSEDSFVTDLIPLWLRLNESSPSSHTFRLESSFFDVIWSLRTPKANFGEWLRSLVAGLSLETLVDRYAANRPDDAAEYYRFVESFATKKRLFGWTLLDMAQVGERVQLTTIHSSKGAQFDAVIFAGFDQLPMLGRSISPIDYRLAYVGVTRAKSHLYLLYTDPQASFVTALKSGLLNDVRFIKFDGNPSRKL